MSDYNELIDRLDGIRRFASNPGDREWLTETIDALRSLVAEIDLYEAAFESIAVHLGLTKDASRDDVQEDIDRVVAEIAAKDEEIKEAEARLREVEEQLERVQPLADLVRNAHAEAVAWNRKYPGAVQHSSVKISMEFLAALISDAPSGDAS